MPESQSKAQKTCIIALFPIKTWSQKIPSSGWGLGLGNLSQNSLKPTPLTSLVKNLKSKTLQFFSSHFKRLATYFEYLNSSLAQLPGEL